MLTRCHNCDGDGEFEMCRTCTETVDNCACDDDSTLPEVDFEECSECHGTGEVEEEDNE